MWLAMGFLGIAGIAAGSESLTSHNYNLMVFTCKLFPVAEPVGGNNFINYALDNANRERERAGERERERLRQQLATPLAVFRLASILIYSISFYALK